nr:MAG TPA: hypothetical protein [Caudoviricetes sp.]DAJ62913.1 MAG TPA: hypothetical protein [Caudoviricetes sp.]DAP27417.1 MAG TPA: hypothetical protein [Caudoviricetes sp.]
MSAICKSYEKTIKIEEFSSLLHHYYTNFLSTPQRCTHRPHKA